IEFGVHLPPGVEKKIDELLKQLGSENYKQRDVAVKELVALGAHSYPALHHASKSSDPEGAQRVQVGLKRIRAKIPAKHLRLREEHQVVTPTCTIVGRIVNATIKARAENFGDLNLKVSQLRIIRSLSGSGEMEVTVDAAKYGSAPNQWMDAGFLVAPS